MDPVWINAVASDSEIIRQAFFLASRPIAQQPIGVLGFWRLILLDVTGLMKERPVLLHKIYDEKPTPHSKINICLKMAKTMRKRKYIYYNMRLRLFIVYFIIMILRFNHALFFISLLSFDRKNEYWHFLALTNKHLQVKTDKSYFMWLGISCFLFKLLMSSFSPKLFCFVMNMHATYFDGIYNGRSRCIPNLKMTIKRFKIIFAFMPKQQDNTIAYLYFLVKHSKANK